MGKNSSKQLGKKIKQEILSLTTKLIELGISIDQNYPQLVEANTKQGLKIKISPKCETFDNKIIFNEEFSYSEMYAQLQDSRVFNLEFLDGALLTFSYEIDMSGITNHRLAFFPSVNLLSLESDDGVDLSENIYSDVVSRNIHPFPIRLDFDKIHAEDCIHPASHLTLGQYKNCRIPVNAPVTPIKFINFILKNFYNTFYIEKVQGVYLTKSDIGDFEETITDNERNSSGYFVI
ncbi:MULTISPECIES: DUF2290 domain-containing protein [Lactococcus]|uniref:DUF2290 domain-containing protein n=4 Tax=Lactococcus petauri TaxID=1940789 RepID=A0ABZ2SL76_9LACT|nr:MULTISPECIES: DUF2290 domain-containing protein [Lactococcus]MCV5952192.1 DUF2290 domain-containing protein [Lactococcus petauri]MCV5966733.1 DUF2290 domain-containing protein [Lactococcus petauri]MCV5969213.1 DUF2290 domain-containing protein [Lactococcus petauri]MCV5980047.1 DUF2290 domain-containing protein [Lactococcus petauri]TBH79989.1 DUF2290 domain-containing protein [Lactococcus petauri]